MKDIKKSISAKSVNRYQINQDIILTHQPKVGDVAIFEVVKVGLHTTLQSPQASNIYLFEGDLIMGTFGNRYATQVLEGLVPDSPTVQLQMLGKGGVVGLAKSANKKTEEKGFTELRLVGYATDIYTNEVLNTIQIAANQSKVNKFKSHSSKIIISIGSAMDSGKTTTAGYLCGGLKRSGFSTAYIKLTGTVFAKDCTFAKSRGADISIDFSSLGYPSTYLCSLDELMDIYYQLIQMVQQLKSIDYIVIEIADGLLQRETQMLLTSSDFMKNVDKVIFSAGDSLGILGGLRILRKWDIFPFAVSGLFTVSPLLVEEVQAVVDVPILTLEEILEINPQLFAPKALFTRAFDYKHIALNLQ